MKETILLKKNDTLNIEDNKLIVELPIELYLVANIPKTFQVPLDLSPVSICENSLEISWELDYDLAARGVVLLAVKKLGDFLQITAMNLTSQDLHVESGYGFMSGSVAARVGLKAVNTDGANKDITLV